MYRAHQKTYRRTISLIELAQMFPDEESACKWFEKQRWGDGRTCPKCGSRRTVESRHKTMPYWCSEGRHYFSVKTGTALEASNVSLQKWVWAIYLEVTSPKGVSSMKLHRDLGVTQRTAWFMRHRIREAFATRGSYVFIGPVEVDETYIGGKEKNKHLAKRLRKGRGAVGKVAVVGAKDRPSNQVAASVIESTTAATLRGFVDENVEEDAVIYTDGASAYRGQRHHEAVFHSRGEYGRGEVHTNGIESFWAVLKRGYNGTYHYMSPKHLQRYVNEFTGRHNLRDLGVERRMKVVWLGLAGRRLRYAELVS